MTAIAEKTPAAATLPLATVHGLFHIAIKTSDLEATRVFWRDVIGLRERSTSLANSERGRRLGQCSSRDIMVGIGRRR